MKNIFTLFLVLFMNNINAQKINSIFITTGINHSGFIIKESNSKTQNDFKDQFNPNIFAQIGTDIKLKNGFDCQIGLGLRKTGTKYLAPITTLQFPEGNGQFENVIIYFHQAIIPIQFSYSFGEKYQIKPFIGFVNNFNYKKYTTLENNPNKIEKILLSNGLADIKKYYLNGLVGFTFGNDKLFSSKLGLSLKCAYERSLKYIGNQQSAKINQAILSSSLVLNYNFN